MTEEQYAVVITALSGILETTNTMLEYLKVCALGIAIIGGLTMFRIVSVAKNNKGIWMIPFFFACSLTAQAQAATNVVITPLTTGALGRSVTYPANFIALGYEPGQTTLRPAIFVWDRETAADDDGDKWRMYFILYLLDDGTFKKYEGGLLSYNGTTIHLIDLTILPTLIGTVEHTSLTGVAAATYTGYPAQTHNTIYRSWGWDLLQMAKVDWEGFPALGVFQSDFPQTRSRVLGATGIATYWNLTTAPGGAVGGLGTQNTFMGINELDYCWTEIYKHGVGDPAGYKIYRNGAFSTVEWWKDPFVRSTDNWLGTGGSNFAKLNSVNSWYGGDASYKSGWVLRG